MNILTLRRVIFGEVRNTFNSNYSRVGFLLDFNIVNNAKEWLYYVGEGRT